jgi:cytoskeletal protein CcmA (bactofilin family)
MLQRGQSLFTSREDRLRREQRPAAPAAAFTPPPAESARQSESARSESKDKDASSQTPTAAKSEEASKSRLIVGPEITLKSAEITDCDTIVVEGRVEVTTDARVMQIAETGTIVGTVGVDIAEVRGRFEGDLTVRKTLVIHPTGRVTGKIRYGKLVIEEGGELSGEVGTLAGAGKPAAALTSTAKSSDAGAAAHA